MISIYFIGMMEIGKSDVLLYISSHLHVYQCAVVSLKLARVEAFTPRTLANHGSRLLSSLQLVGKSAHHCYSNSPILRPCPEV